MAAARVLRFVRGWWPVLGLGVVALSVVGVFAWRWATALGPDELPATMNDSHRKAILRDVRRFFDGVNQYNPQVAGEAMLPPNQLGMEEFARLVVSIGPYQSQKLTCELRALAEAHIEAERGVAVATVATNFGPKRMDVVRRNGVWKLASVPDLRPPEQIGTLKLSWDVLNTFEAGGRWVVIGRIRNNGDKTAQFVAAAGYVTDEAGRTLRTELSTLVARPFVPAGQETHFRLDFQLPKDAKPDVSRFVLIPNLRQGAPADETTLVPEVFVEPARLEQLQPGVAPIETYVSNGSTRKVRAFVVGYVYDAAGKLLAVGGARDEQLAPGERRQVGLAPVAAGVPSAASMRVEVWAAEVLG